MARTQITPNNDAALKIVAINSELRKHLPQERRDALVSTQRTLWESVFPGASFEQIAATAH